MDDVFEVFQVNFSVNHPEPDINDELRIIGKKGQIGTHMMIKDSEPVEWMPNKHGMAWTPFKVTITMDNKVSGIDGQWEAATADNIIEYEYEFKNKVKQIHNHERAPKRIFSIENPSNYRGQLGAA